MSVVTNAPLPKGTLLQKGKYRISRQIGKGGFGITYKATAVITATGNLGQTRYEAPVVIKELFYKDYCSRNETTGLIEISNLSQREQFETLKKKILKEGQRAYSFNHPNIVKVNEIFEENNTAYIVMDFIDGKDLDSYIREKNHYTWEDFYPIAKDLFNALKEVHKKKILHLDIKPNNILIDEDGVAKLIDFGLSMTYTESGSSVSTLLSGVSGSFSPIEQYNPSGITSFTPQTDVYALGATFYYALSGKKLPEATHRSQEDDDGFADITSANKTVNRYLSLVIQKAVSIRIKQRYATVADFEKAFFGEEVYNRFIEEAGTWEEKNEWQRSLDCLNKASELLDIDAELIKKKSAIQAKSNGKKENGNRSNLHEDTWLPGKNKNEEKNNETNEQSIIDERVENFIKQGDDSYNRGAYKAARTYYSNALQIQPSSRHAQLGLEKSELNIKLLATDEANTTQDKTRAFGKWLTYVLIFALCFCVVYYLAGKLTDDKTVSPGALSIQKLSASDLTDSVKAAAKDTVKDTVKTATPNTELFSKTILKSAADSIDADVFLSEKSKNMEQDYYEKLNEQITGKIRPSFLFKIIGSIKNNSSLPVTATIIVPTGYYKDCENSEEAFVQLSTKKQLYTIKAKEVKQISYTITLRPTRVEPGINRCDGINDRKIKVSSYFIK